MLDYWKRRKGVPYAAQRWMVLVVMILFLFLFTGCELFPEEEELLAPPLIEPVAVSYSTVKAKRGDIVTPFGVGFFCFNRE